MSAKKVSKESTNRSFSAPDQAEGYLYQIRYALLQILRLSEESLCLIEKDDDIDFSDPDEGKILASLKHKAPGDLLTDLSPDFWKSVRIWLNFYIKNNIYTKPVSFFLFTTGQVATGSFLEVFLPDRQKDNNLPDRIREVLSKSESKTIDKTKKLLNELSADKWKDFFNRILIFDVQERIQKIPDLIKKERFRPIRLQFRDPIYERFEGWWLNVCIEMLSGERIEPIRGYEVSEKLGNIADQFREDTLPIDFEYTEPTNGVHPETDDRYFVKQLNVIGLKSDRIKRAILDYYRAFEQRNLWLRENVTLSGELEQYDDRLVDEWGRLREIIFEEIDNNSSEELLKKTGRKLLTNLSTSENPNLRIRTGVTATFVTMGSYHMLANDKSPRVYWHPRFIERIEEIFCEK